MLTATTILIGAPLSLSGLQIARHFSAIPHFSFDCATIRSLPKVLCAYIMSSGVLQTTVALLSVSTSAESSESECASMDVSVETSRSPAVGSKKKGKALSGIRKFFLLNDDEKPVCQINKCGLKLVSNHSHWKYY